MHRHTIKTAARALLMVGAGVALAWQLSATAGNCPPAPNGNAYHVYYEFYWVEGSEDYNEWMRRVDRTLEPFHATCPIGTSHTDNNSTQYRTWRNCPDPNDYRKAVARHPSWPAEIQDCTGGG